MSQSNQQYAIQILEGLLENQAYVVLGTRQSSEPQVPESVIKAEIKRLQS